MNDEKAIKDLIQVYTKALHEKDGGNLAATYADDAVVYEQAPPLQVNADKIKDPTWYQPWFDSWEGGVDSTLYKPTFQIDGNLAVCYALLNVKGIKKPDIKIDRWFRSTMAFHKQDGEWKIIHVHNSAPFAMDGSDKAALDLKPE